MTLSGAPIAKAHSDCNDVLVAADELLASLQLRCGGELPGPIAIPALLVLVRKARGFGLPLARAMTASDGHEQVTAWVEVRPAPDGGTAIAVRSWQVGPLPPEDLAEVAERRIVIERAVAELVARLDAHQRVLSVETSANDLTALALAMGADSTRPWTDFVAVAGSQHHQPLHWRLLDGASVTVEESTRTWRASLHPVGTAGTEPAGFELCLSADTPAEPRRFAATAAARADTGQRLVGRDVAPVLRQPIARIIANAETIRTRLAGPLAEEYSRYAADIATAGQHLLSLVEDLADLEVVEAEDFNTAPDRIDLADVARRAAGILGVRARERGIGIVAPQDGESLPAIAEFRRVLQVLLNLVGNAIRYSPEGSQVWIRLEDAGPRARVIVADQGPGLSAAQHSVIFDKFERLGRSDEGGSGLGLYISRRLARAMGGDLTLDSAPGQGARFILEVPGDLLATPSAPREPQH